jgi:hypothetical protein
LSPTADLPGCGADFSTSREVFSIALMPTFDRILHPRQHIRVKDVLHTLAGGATEAEILQDFPDLESGDIQAATAYAAATLDDPMLFEG